MFSCNIVIRFAALVMFNTLCELFAIISFFSRLSLPGQHGFCRLSNLHLLQINVQVANTGDALKEIEVIILFRFHREHVCYECWFPHHQSVTI